MCREQRRKALHIGDIRYHGYTLGMDPNEFDSRRLHSKKALHTTTIGVGLSVAMAPVTAPVNTSHSLLDQYVGGRPTRRMLFAAILTLILLLLGTAGRAEAQPRLVWQGPVIATWYGPGFYGNTFACGGRYHRSTRGVAHRTLPCGSHVTFRWRGRYVRAKVIDRGPYSGATFDFTARTAMDLCRCSRPYTIHGIRWKRT